MSGLVTRHQHRPSLKALLLLEREVRGCERHPNDAALQNHYDAFLDAVDLAKSGQHDDIINAARLYTVYANARDAQGGSL